MEQYPHLSCWERQAEGVDQGAQRSEARVDGLDVRRREQMQPWQEQTATDVGLEQESQVIERVLPTSARVPGGMSLQCGGRGRRWGISRRGRRSHVAEGGEGRTLQTDERVGTHDQLPPALDAGIVGDAVVGPAQIIFGVFEAILNGLVTNDKFCLSRSARLHLSHWHLPVCRRLGPVAQEVYPAHQRVGVGGYTNEASQMAGPPPVCGKVRRPASV